MTVCDDMMLLIRILLISAKLSITLAFIQSFSFNCFNSVFYSYFSCCYSPPLPATVRVSKPSLTPPSYTVTAVAYSLSRSRLSMPTRAHPSESRKRTSSRVSSVQRSSEPYTSATSITRHAGSTRSWRTLPLLQGM